MRKLRLSAIFIFLGLLNIYYIAGCMQYEVMKPEDVWNSPRFKKHLTPEPGIEEEITRLELIQYRENLNAPLQELGYMKTIRFVVPFKKWDEKSKIEGIDGGVNVRLDGSFKFARREASGEIIFYEAVHKTIWQISDLKGDPIGFINDYGMIYKWDSKIGKLKNYGTGSFRRAIMLLFNLNWNFYLYEAPERREFDFGFSRLSEKSSSDIRIIGIEESEAPIVLLKEMDVAQLQQRYEKNLKPLSVQAKDIRGIPVSDAERAEADEITSSGKTSKKSSSDGW